jgi:hypothetical protein
LAYVGRPASASPATASYRAHLRQQAELMETAINGRAARSLQAVSRGREQLVGDDAVR